jgi:aminoglycoside 6'-N-acetyltransferase I
MYDVVQYSEMHKAKVAECLRRAFAREPWNEDWSVALALERVENLSCPTISSGWLMIDWDADAVVAGLFGRKTVYVDRYEYFVDELFVDPDYQRKGNGSALMRDVYERLKRMGYFSVVLNTERGCPAEQFYTACGFRRLDRCVFLFNDLG